MERCMRWAATALALAGFASQLTGCGMTPEKEVPPKPFTGTRWVVQLELPLRGEQPSFRFGDGRMEGFAGCNQVSARYIRDTVGAGAIAIGRIDTGRRACDPSAAAAEERVLQVLQAVSSFIIIADTMRMSGSGGTLNFRAIAEKDGAGGGSGGAAAGGGAPAALLGTRWVGAEGTSDPRAAPRLEFADEGRLTGSTGCNSISGQWRVENGEIRFSALAVTKRMCVGEGGEIEKRFLAAFSEQSRGVREGDRLVVISPSGTRYAFTAAAAA